MSNDEKLSEVLVEIEYNLLKTLIKRKYLSTKGLRALIELAEELANRVDEVGEL
jgi:hypothetical protein